MSVITNNISGSVSNSSVIGITGSVIIGNASGGSFPVKPTDTVFFVSGSNTSRSVFGGTVFVSGSLFVGTDALDTITLGSTAQTGTTLLGQSIATNTINIGNANTADTKTQTINIGAGTGVTSGKSLVTIGSTANDSALTLNAGSGSINIGTSDSVRTTNIATNGVWQTINIGTGYGLRTIYIGNQATDRELEPLSSTTIRGDAVQIAASGYGQVDIGTQFGEGSLTLETGIGNIDIGASPHARTMQIGTGAANQTVTLGSTHGGSALTLSAGSGSINIGTSASTRTTNIATGASNQTVTLGSTHDGSALTLNAGSGSINIGTSTAANQTVILGSTHGGSALTLNAGSGSINIGTFARTRTTNIATGASNQTVTLGSTHGGSSLTLSAGSGSINIASSFNNVLVGIGTASPSNKLDVYADDGGSWAASFYHDGNNTNRYGIRIQSGTDTAGGDLIDFYDGSGDLQGTISFNAGTVTYGSFTGDHYAKILDSSTNKIYGTIVKIVQATSKPNRKNINYIVEKTTFMKDQAVLGVFASSFETPSDESLKDHHSIFSLGDGHILVTDQGGNISIGDYICSSDYPGHGMKQDDNILRSYTVAKSTYAIDFSTLEVDPINGVKSVLISCTYHCG